ncbi:hypothetical protein JCM11251_006814 [Rhodosporidiobolus azoricus]
MPAFPSSTSPPKGAPIAPHHLFSQPFPTPSLNHQQQHAQHADSYFHPPPAPDPNGDDPLSTPSSPLSSSPFSLRSHKLRELREGHQQRGGELFAMVGQGGAGATPFFDAIEGEALFGPQPASVSRGRGRGGAASPDERKRLREKYALGKEEEEKLGRLLGAVYGRIGGARRAGGEPAAYGGITSTSPDRPFTPAILSLPDSPPSTTSSRKSRLREQAQTIETVLASARSSPSTPLQPVPSHPSRGVEEPQYSTPKTTRAQSSSDRFQTPPEEKGPTGYSPLAQHIPPPSTGTLHRSPRTPYTPLWNDEPAPLPTTTPQDSPRPLLSRSAYSPPRSASTPPFQSAYNPFSPTAPIVSPPTSPPAERSLTPFPTPPPPNLPSSFPDHFYQRPATHRQLGYDFLPSRSGIRASNFRPRVDSEMSEEEKQWVERTRRVVNDGGLRDWWGFPVGERGQWGRAVLSPILTETEPTHTSPSTSSIRSPYVQRFRCFSDAAAPLITRSRSAGAPSPSNSSRQSMANSAFPSGSTSAASGAALSPSRSPRKKRELPASPLTNGMVLSTQDQENHLYASPSSLDYSAAPFPSTDPSLPGAFHDEPPPRSRSSRSTSRSAPHKTTPTGASFHSPLPQAGAPSLWIERDGKPSPVSHGLPSPPSETLGNVARSPSGRGSKRERAVGEALRTGTPTSGRSSRTDAIANWARKIELGTEDERGSPSSRSSPTKEEICTGHMSAVPESKVDNKVGVRSDRASIRNWRKSLAERAAAAVSENSSSHRAPNRPSPSSLSSTSPEKPSLPRPSPPVEAAVDLPNPDAPRQPSGRSPNDIAAWAKTATGAQEPPTPSIEQRRSPKKADGTAKGGRASPYRQEKDPGPSTCPQPFQASASAAPAPSQWTGAASSSANRKVAGPDLCGDGGQLSMTAILSSLPSHPSPHDCAQPSHDGPYSPRSPAAPNNFVGAARPPSAASRFEQDPRFSFGEQDGPVHFLPEHVVSGGMYASRQAREDGPGGYIEEDPFSAGQADRPFSPVVFPAGDVFSAASPTSLRRGSPVNPYRRDPFPVPQLTEEEKEARRELRKAGKSPEFNLPIQETKSERRKIAWKEQQRFEKQKEHLLRMLGDPSSRSDVPVYNALAQLHLSASIPATREMAEHFLVSSLSLDEAQPEVAHLLALQLEERDLPEAIHWHRIALRYGIENPEYHLSLASALFRSGNLDRALDAYGTLSQAFPQSPYEALALYHLGRLYRDCGQVANVAEAYQSALQVLQGLRLVEPENRTGGRWDQLEDLERLVLESLSELGPDWSGEAPPAGRRTSQTHASPATLRRPPASFASPSTFHHGPVRSPSAPPDIASLASDQTWSSAAIDRYESAARMTAATQMEKSASSRLSPSTLNHLLSTLRSLSGSSIESAQALLSSKEQLASDLEEAFAALKEVSKGERERGEELRREVDELERVVKGLPGKLVGTAKLVAARPPSAPPPPPVQTRKIDSLDDALQSLERIQADLGL